jgi:hypothetical protein
MLKESRNTFEEIKYLSEKRSRYKCSGGRFSLLEIYKLDYKLIMDKLKEYENKI